MKGNASFAPKRFTAGGDKNDFIAGISFSIVGFDFRDAESVRGADEIERLNAVIADDPDAQWFHDPRVAPGPYVQNDNFPTNQDIPLRRSNRFLFSARRLELAPFEKSYV